MDLLREAELKLADALSFPEGESFRESTIQRFEYTFELSWKLISSILSDEGMSVAGIRDTIRNGARLNLIENPERWLEYAKARNLTSHLYLEAVASQVYEVACGDFVVAVRSLIAEAAGRVADQWHNLMELGVDQPSRLRLHLKEHRLCSLGLPNVIQMYSIN